MKVLVIEDDTDLTKLISATLANHHAVVDLATDGEMGLALVEAWDYDVILLDVGLPKIDGITVCRQLRQQGCSTPILMLTAQSSTRSVVTGLDAGADDYVIKPFDPDQLMARLRALQRRKTPTLSPTVRTWGDLTLDPVLRLVTYGQRDIALSPKEYALLDLFLRHPKRIFSRSAIIDHLWTMDQTPTEATVTNLVKDLRRRLKTAGLTDIPVETLHGSGYRLKALPQTTPAADPCPPITPPPSPQPDSLPSLEQIADQFLSTLPDRLAILDAAQTALGQGHLPADHQAEARAMAHRLTGSLGTFGYGPASDAMRAIEHLLSDPFPLSPEVAQPLADRLNTLRQHLTQPPSFVAPVAPEVGATTVLMVDSDTAFTQSIEKATDSLAYTVIAAADLATAYHRLTQHRPDALVINLGATASPASTLDFLANLTTDFPDLPILVLADQDTLEQRTAIIPYRVQRFVAKPISPLELIALVTQVIAEAQSATEAQPQAPTAMIVDDDPIILKTLSGWLLAQGIQTTCLLHPSQFWPLLKASNPALLLLDVAMPDYDGLELCKTVRQDAQYRDLPILVITSSTEADAIHNAFAAGADEVFSKPVCQDQILSRIQRYLARRRPDPT